MLLHCSLSPGKHGISPKKIYTWKKSWRFKKEHFAGKIMEFCFSYPHFVSNIRINFAEFILCHVLLIGLIFDYWWLHLPKYFDVKTIESNNNNLGKLHNFHGIEQPGKITWYHGKIVEFCFEWEPCIINNRTT